VAKGGGYVIGAMERGKIVYKSCCGGITVLRLGWLGAQSYMGAGDLSKRQQITYCAPLAVLLRNKE